MRNPQEMAHDNLIVSHIAGSLAYGTNLPTSDRDVRGVFCVDKEFYLSPWHSCGEVNVSGEEDTKYYEVSKFLTLVVDQNPNILETLWVRQEDILHADYSYRWMRRMRQELLCTKAKHTYCGYAHEQLKRIKGHERWLANPQPETPPRQIDFLTLVQDFSLTVDCQMSELVKQLRVGFAAVPYGNNIFGLYVDAGRELYADDGRFLLNRGEPHWHKNEEPNLIFKFNEQEYRLALDNHTNYWHWKNNRNAARSALEAKYGYDTKHAMHLVRLLRTGYEILTEGVVHVYRHDAKELLEIRNGKYSYEGILEYAQELQDKVESAYKTTTLRKRVDTNKVAELLAEILDYCWGR
jgi:predicted nucleotidyltransferase